MRLSAAQYSLNGCCLRAPWIMEKDDFKFADSNVFYVPDSLKKLAC